MTFLLSSTSYLVKLPIISCFPAIANDHKASNGAIHHSCCSVHVIKFFKQSGRSPIELKLCSVTNRQDTIIPDAFFFFLWLQSTYSPGETIPIVDTTLLSNYAAQKKNSLHHRQALFHRYQQYSHSKFARHQSERQNHSLSDQIT